MKTYMYIPLAILLGLLSSQAGPDKNSSVDGVKIVGLEIALAHVRGISKDWPLSFDITKYTVVIEEDLSYYFEPKLAPGEKPQPGNIMKNGIAFRAKVVPKTFKVVSITAE